MSAAPSPASPPVAPAPRSTGDEIARVLVEAGVLAPDRLAYARRVHGKLADGRSLLAVVREIGLASDEQVRDALRGARHSIRLGALLVELGELSASELDAALEAQKSATPRRKLGEILVEQRFVEEHRLIDVLSSQLGFPRVHPDATRVERTLYAKASPAWCEQIGVLPMKGGAEGERVLAMADPLDTPARNAAREVFGVDLAPAIAGRLEIRQAIAELEGRRTGGLDADHAADDKNVIGIVHAMLKDALQQGASDIHIEPLRNQLRVRFRCDGALVLYRDFERALMPNLVSRIKIMAGADIAEKRRHQDGRSRFEDAATGLSCDLRVSVFSTLHGQKIVLRLLTRKAQLLDIKELGFAPRMLERFTQDALDIPSGVILVTGPTGSGKTTTLYGAVNYLNSTDVSIITAEDPVEYVIDGIAQCSINPQLNVTFEETLRHMVRQDPDVIVLGEIRDKFSAETAIQAALTGHKVLTTFHTEDTIGGLLRLMNMDIETFMISSTVVSVLAQRLVRRVCKHCAKPCKPTPADYKRLGCQAADLAGAAFRAGRGCPHCRHTGYAGRVSVFELLVLNEQVKEAILARRTSSEIRRISVETSGLVTLLEDGLVKAAAGETSLAEILRHLPRLGRTRPLADLRRILGT